MLYFNEPGRRARALAGRRRGPPNRRVRLRKPVLGAALNITWVVPLPGSKANPKRTGTAEHCRWSRSAMPTPAFTLCLGSGRSGPRCLGSARQREPGLSESLMQSEEAGGPARCLAVPAGRGAAVSGSQTIQLSPSVRAVSAPWSVPGPAGPGRGTSESRPVWRLVCVLSSAISEPET
jgi:hypothetical protein